MTKSSSGWKQWRCDFCRPQTQTSVVTEVLRAMSVSAQQTWLHFMATSDTHYPATQVIALMKILIRINVTGKRLLHTESQQTRLPLWGRAGDAPPRSLAARSPLAVRFHYTQQEYQLFCWDAAALPTTAAAKEREGKPGCGQQAKIDITCKKMSFIFRFGL